MRAHGTYLIEKQESTCRRAAVYPPSYQYMLLDLLTTDLFSSFRQAKREVCFPPEKPMKHERAMKQKCTNKDWRILLYTN